MPKGRKFRYTKAEVHEMATLGALQRYRELLEEAAAIQDQFPKVRELLEARLSREGGAPRNLPEALLEPREPKARKKSGPANPLTPEQRKKIGARMKKYWANRKKALGVAGLAKDVRARMQGKPVAPAAKKGSKAAKPAKAAKAPTPVKAPSGAPPLETRA